MSDGPASAGANRSHRHVAAAGALNIAHLRLRGLEPHSGVEKCKTFLMLSFLLLKYYSMKTEKADGIFRWKRRPGTTGTVEPSDRSELSPTGREVAQASVKLPE